MADALSSRRHARPPTLLRRVDARVKILGLMAACFVTQYCPDPYLPVWLAALCLLFLVREMRTEKVLGLIRGASGFMLFWLVMKTGSGILGGDSFARAFTDSLPLAWRLATLSLVGMAIVGLSSPVEMGRAIAWYIRPIIGDSAWKPALVIALTAWFLPITLRLAGDVAATIKSRGLVIPWRKKVLLIIGTALRVLERKAAELAVGIASRRADDYRTWL